MEYCLSSEDADAEFVVTATVRQFLKKIVFLSLSGKQQQLEIKHLPTVSYCMVS
jgi:hypothetical protein